MQKTFKIGLIGKPHGVRGEVKVTPLTDDVAKFSRIKKVLIDGKEYGVISVKKSADAVFIAFSGVNDRNASELLRGKFLEVRREDEEPLSDFSFYVTDLLGLTVVLDSGEEIGKISDITSLKTDVFTVSAKDGKTVRFPFLKDLLVSVDYEAETLTIREKRFFEVALYEN